MDKPFLSRVRLQNYRSIAACDVHLAPLTFLVGPNGSGKSNFLDALRLTAESLRTSLEHALRERGGIKEVRRKSSGHPTNFAIGLDFNLPDNRACYYAFHVAAGQGGEYEVQRERCHIKSSYFDIQRGKVIATSTEVAPPASKDRLYLVNAAGLPEFRPVYEALSRMSFFNPVPDIIRAPQPPDPGEILVRDGRNLASVYERLCNNSGDIRNRIEDYLNAVVQGVKGVEVIRSLGYETLVFRQEVASGKTPWRFNALSMSDGTLRAFGILVALFQWAKSGDFPSLIGLEEPEMALHPAAAGVLLDALVESAEKCQVLVTTHSPDLLDSPNVATENLLAVMPINGQTKIGPVNDAGRESLKEQLFTAGELLRLSQLEPDPSLTDPAQLKLFERWWRPLDGGKG